jgi:predicted metal-dependent phosphoesterase TrpH
VTPTDLVDLHLHSNRSDGSDSPAELVRTAFEHGCRYLALTDHDTLSGLEEASHEARTVDINLLGGAELSVTFEGGSMHLLVYLRHGEGEAIEEHLEALRAGRRVRNLAIVAAMNYDGIPLRYEQVVAKSASEEAVGRPHFAATLVDLGLVESMQDAFDRYLATGRPYDLPRKSLTLADAIDLVRASQGVSVVAHPLTLGHTTTALASIAFELHELGVDGLEAHYGRYRLEVRQELDAIARSSRLLATGGSDYHGTFKVGLAPGVGEGDLRVPLRCFNDLNTKLNG